eukprot:6990334-Prymnesium_polylepis.1
MHDDRHASRPDSRLKYMNSLSMCAAAAGLRTRFFQSVERKNSSTPHGIHSIAGRFCFTSFSFDWMAP